MTLTKAIEIETIHNDHNPNFTDAEREEAHQLGIEALIREENNRINPGAYYDVLLPSETKD